MPDRWPRIFSLLDIFRRLFFWMGWLSTRFGNLLRVAFPPPDPAHRLGELNWRRSISRMVEPFKAFVARVLNHPCYRGGRFKLLRSPLLAV